MQNFFRYDGAASQILRLFLGLFWLNILTLVCSLPLITAGAASVACHHVVWTLHEDTGNGVTREFFRAFAQNFAKATALWLLFAGVGLFLAADAYLVLRLAAPYRSVLLAVLFVLLFVYAMLLAWVFALTARFENTLARTVYNAFILGLGHLPRSVLMVLLGIAPFLLAYISAEGFAAAALLGCVAPVYLSRYLYAPVFKSLIHE